LERWYNIYDKYLGYTGQGKNKRCYIQEEIEQVPFALYISPDEHKAIGWKALT
jgi:hypothetical protein